MVSDNGHYQRPGCFSLFSGIGGIDLAFEQAGFEIIGQVENDEFCNRVLSKHWPYVPRWGDVRHVRGTEVQARLRLHGGTGAVDVMVGGFPCQDISIAGKLAGITGERSGLFFEFARLVSELRPRVVFLENVANITVHGGTAVIATLTALGYDCEWGIVPASIVGAPHRRERWFCVAYAHERGCGALQNQRQDGHVPAGSGKLGNPPGTGLEGANLEKSAHAQSSQPDYGPSQPRLGRVLDGLSFRVDGSQFPAPPDQPQKEWEAPRASRKVPNHANRIAALGNAVVPQVVFPFAVAIRRFMEAHQ